MNLKLSYLFDHPYNGTINNERAVEIPLAFRYIDYVNGDLIEVGAVMPYYSSFPHECIDPADKKANRKEFAQNCDYTNKNVLSISTIEHIGQGDYKLTKDPGSAVPILQKIYQESKSCLLTWAIGYNKDLDDAARSDFGHFFIVRSGNLQWDIVEDETGFNHEYGKPFIYGNSVIVIYKNVEWLGDYDGTM